MVQIRAHGGGCCGIRHIHGFGARHGGPNQTQQNVRDLLQIMSQANVADNRQMLEINLSDMQTREHPELLQEMARFGFVYTNAWIGQHGTPVHQFVRAKNRVSLNRRRFEWNGMVASAALTGELPAWNERGNNNNPNIRVGSEVRINSPASQYDGQRATVMRLFRNERGTPVAELMVGMVERAATIVVANLAPIRTPERIIVIPNGRDRPLEENIRIGDYVIIRGGEPRRRRVTGAPGLRDGASSTRHFINLGEGDERMRTYVHNLSRHIIPAVEEAAPGNRQVYRHREEGGNGNNAADNPAPARIIREYYALFQNGRTSGPYDSPAAVREANPRVIRYRRRDIYSDGRTENNDQRFRG